jgi:hypothetical protein
MGIRCQVTCNQCGHEFEVNIGGGFISVLLHCDRCGKEKWVELPSRSLRGLPRFDPRTMTSGQPSVAGVAPPPNPNQRSPSAPPTLSAPKPPNQQPTLKRSQKYTEHCDCGGQFKEDARARCPRCNSDDWRQGDIIIYYD